MDGGQCTIGLVGVLDVGGKIRSDFIALQEAVKAAQGQSPPVKKAKPKVLGIF